MRVGGARPPPLFTFTITSKVAVYTPAEWADTLKAGSLKMNTALEYSTRVVQEGGRRCKKSTLKGTVSRDFRLLVFFMNQLPPSI